MLAEIKNLHRKVKDELTFVDTALREIETLDKVNVLKNIDLINQDSYQQGSIVNLGQVITTNPARIVITDILESGYEIGKISLPDFYWKVMQHNSEQILISSKEDIRIQADEQKYTSNRLSKITTYFTKDEFCWKLICTYPRVTPSYPYIGNIGYVNFQARPVGAVEPVVYLVPSKS